LVAKVPNRYFGSRVTTRAELNEIAQYHPIRFNRQGILSGIFLQTSPDFSSGYKTAKKLHSGLNRTNKATVKSNKIYLVLAVVTLVIAELSEQVTQATFLAATGMGASVACWARIYIGPI
jgi:hypothetical protein